MEQARRTWVIDAAQSVHERLERRVDLVFGVLQRRFQHAESVRAMQYELLVRLVEPVEQRRARHRWLDAQTVKWAPTNQCSMHTNAPRTASTSVCTQNKVVHKP